MCTSIISVSKIAHQISCNHPFSQRNKTTEGAVGVAVGGNRERGCWTQFEKREEGGGGLSNIGGSL